MDLVLLQTVSEGYSYQPVPSISEEVFWYRSGNKYLNTCNFMHFEENDNNLIKILTMRTNYLLAFNSLLYSNFHSYANKNIQCDNYGITYYVETF